jgi:SNF2 family DNA or RNA helicase
MQYPVSKTTPWNHQTEAWKFFKQNKASYIAHDMGCGKTKFGVDACAGISAKRVLIVCPKKVIQTWIDQFQIHGAMPVMICAPDKGTAADKAKKIHEDLVLANETGNRVVVILNYEIYWRLPLGPKTNEKHRVIDKGELLKWQWDLLILDEAHRIKSPGGKASWQAFRLARRAYRKIFLSGTPIPHSPLDIYAQYRALNPRIFGTNFVTFRGRYAVLGGYENKQILSWQNTKDLNEKIFSAMHRVEADDVLELPPRTDRMIHVDLNSRGRKIYNQMRKDLIAFVESELRKGHLYEMVAKNSLVKMLRLQQMAAGIAQFDDGLVEIIDTQKSMAVQDFIEDLPPKEFVVVFHKFTPEGDALQHYIEKIEHKLPDGTKFQRTVARISGQHDELQLFKEGKRNVAVVQIDSGAEGIDLSRARYAIYTTPGLSLGKYRQSRRRLRRPSEHVTKERKIFFYHVLCNDTIDQKVFQALIEKKTVVDFVLGGLYDYIKDPSKAPHTSKISTQELAHLLMQANKSDGQVLQEEAVGDALSIFGAN